MILIVIIVIIVITVIIVIGIFVRSKWMRQMMKIFSDACKVLDTISEALTMIIFPLGG